MPRNPATEQRTGMRYVAALPIKAEWDDGRGQRVVEEGTTENVGPEGVLVHLQRQLPDVGSRVQLVVLGEEGQDMLHVSTEVLRLERNAGHPLAALQLLDVPEEWRGLVWEPAAPRYVERAGAEEEHDDDDADDEEDDAAM